VGWVDGRIGDALVLALSGVVMFLSWRSLVCKQGFPMQFSHLSAPRMLSDLRATSIAQDIIETHGGVDAVRCAGPTEGLGFRV
jgi:hypothetical protein